MPVVMLFRSTAVAASTAVLLALSACGGEAPKPVEPLPAPPPMVSTSAPGANVDAGPTAAPPPAKGQAHALAVLVASCWYGGVWSEAEGADAAETRKAASEARCREATKRVFGTDDKEKYEQLRAYDANAIEDVGKKIAATAKDDATDGPRKDALVKLVTVLATAKKEEMHARRAGERVKRDLAKEPEKLSADEAAAVAPLTATAGLEALLKLDVGDLTGEAHALGVMSAMERMSITRGLPKHLKVYAARGPFKLLFNVDAPAVPEDATKPLKPGTWLGYLVTAAKGAGHAVPDSAKTPAEKEPMAWAGVLEGLHDQLAADAEKISGATMMKVIAVTLARRLEHEYSAERSALRKAQEAAATAPAATPGAKPATTAAPASTTAPKK